MGGAVGTTSSAPFDDFVANEFERVLGQNKGRTYLVLEELMLVEPSFFIPVDFSHIGTLYVLNTSRTGRVPLSEIRVFVKLCFERFNLYRDAQYEHLRAYCTLRMCEELMSSEQSMESFLDW
jgi:hypothetical protein